MKLYYYLLSTIILFVGQCLSSKAQVTISLQVPPSGAIQKAQLWNFMLVSSNPAPLTVAVKLSLISTTDNLPVLTGYSKNLLLTPGAKQVGFQSLSPIYYSLVSPLFNGNTDPNGYLPVGNFMACYTVFKVDGDLSNELVTECSGVGVTPLSPPFLSYPPDNDTLNSLYPQFTWIPPAPINMFTNLSYDLLLAEVQLGQTPTDALEQNLPVYSTTNVRVTTLPYPSSRTGLIPNKKYVWKIVARNNGQIAGQSEVWSFHTKGILPPIAVQASNPGFIKLAKNDEVAQSICNGVLKIEYLNEANDEQAYFSISSLSKSFMDTVATGNLELKNGQNFIDIDLTKYNKLNYSDTYLFQLFNTRNEQWKIKFLNRPKLNE